MDFACCVDLEEKEEPMAAFGGCPSMRELRRRTAEQRWEAMMTKWVSEDESGVGVSGEKSL